MEKTAQQFFPCPVCSSRLDIRKSKKGKPYVVCDVCGVQMFVRNEAGIRQLDKLVAQADQQDAWARLADLQRRFQKSCPKCGKTFWIDDEVIATSWFDGGFIGYRCPDKTCDGLVEADT